MIVGDEDFWCTQKVMIYALFWCKSEQNTEDLSQKYSGMIKASLEWKIHLIELNWLQRKGRIIFWRIILWPHWLLYYGWDIKAIPFFSLSIHFLSASEPILPALNRMSLLTKMESCNKHLSENIFCIMYILMFIWFLGSWILQIL